MHCQATLPAWGFTFRTEAALCPRQGRLHILAHARRRPAKDVTHEKVWCVRGEQGSFYYISFYFSSLLSRFPTQEEKKSKRSFNVIF